MEIMWLIKVNMDIAPIVVQFIMEVEVEAMEEVVEEDKVIFFYVYLRFKEAMLIITNYNFFQKNIFSDFSLCTQFFRILVITWKWVVT